MNTAVTRKDWVGRVIDGRFPLLEWLGSTERAGVFRTELKGPQSQRAVIRLVGAEPHHADARLHAWKQAAALSHPHLMRIYESGHAQVGGVELLYVVSEYADESLAQVIPERPLSAGETREMLGPILDALTYLHGKGLVHGRIKPSNVMVVGDRVKLPADNIRSIGAAGALNQPTTIYDAPELASAAIQPSSDLWSLGITLVEALSQQPPRWERSIRRDPVVPAEIGEPFAEIARACLRYDPAKRATLPAIRALLNPLPSLHEPANEIDYVTPAIGAHAPESRASVPSKGRIAAIAAVIVIVLAAIVFALLRSHPSQPLPPPVAQSPAPAATQPEAPPVPHPAPRRVGTVKGEVAQRVMPDVLASANRTIRGKVAVRVRVNVNADGTVANARLDSPGRSRYFSNSALEAARKWRFEPAQRDGVAVPSVWDLHFLFRRSGPEVNAVEVSR